MRQFRAIIEGQPVGRKDLALVDMAGVEASRAVGFAAVQPGAALPGMIMRERRDAEAGARGRQLGFECGDNGTGQVDASARGLLGAFQRAEAPREERLQVGRGGPAEGAVRAGLQQRQRGIPCPPQRGGALCEPAGAIGSGHGRAVPGTRPARAAQVPRHGNHLLQPVLAGGPAQTMSSFVAESVTSG